MLLIWNIYQHFPHKWTSFVGKYTIHGAYGICYRSQQTSGFRAPHWILIWRSVMGTSWAPWWTNPAKFWRFPVSHGGSPQSYPYLYGIFPWKKPSIMGIIIYFNRIFHYEHPIEPSILGIIFGKLHLGHEWFLCPHSKLSDVRRDRNPHAVPQGARFEVPHTLAVVNPGVDGHKIEAIPCKHWIIYLSSRG